MKVNENFNYNIDYYIGTLKESDSHDWTKSVAKISWGNNPPTIDIRSMNLTQERIGKGISLTNEETDTLVNLLLENDFGSIEALESAIEKKKSLYSPVTDDAVNDYLDDNDNNKTTKPSIRYKKRMD